jgi:hypothetical protein
MWIFTFFGVFHFFRIAFGVNAPARAGEEIKKKFSSKKILKSINLKGPYHRNSLKLPGTDCALKHRPQVTEGLRGEIGLSYGRQRCHTAPFLLLFVSFLRFWKKCSFCVSFLTKCSFLYPFWIFHYFVIFLWWKVVFSARKTWKICLAPSVLEYMFFSTFFLHWIRYKPCEYTYLIFTAKTVIQLLTGFEFPSFPVNSDSARVLCRNSWILTVEIVISGDEVQNHSFSACASWICPSRHIVV